MGSIFRSQEMQRVQLFVQVEAARDTVDEMGKLGLIQFIDLNPTVSAFQRNFVNDLKKCDEMERKLKFFEEQIEREKLEIVEEKIKGKEEMALLRLEDLPQLQIQESFEGKKQRVEEFESRFDELEKELIQMNQNQETMTKNFNELVELKHVLQKDSSFFAEASDLLDKSNPDSESRGLLQEKEEISVNRAVRLGFVTGVLNRDSWITFERVLWRVLRGNLFMKYAPIEEKIKDPLSGLMQEKNVFIIFYQGEKSQQKIKKICESYGANLYSCPDNNVKRNELLVQVNNRLDELENVLSRTKKHRRTMLLDIGRHLKSWKEKLIKEKSIYHTMNMFNYDVGRRCLIAEGWCPKNAIEDVVNAMRQATETSGALVPSILSVVPSNEEPPTYFQTNKFTKPFQAIVDSYGIAHYREVNPAVLTIITFPFLFAIMFGDLGHGFLLLLFALYFVLNEKKLAARPLNEMLRNCFEGRYMLLLMALFSMYTGLLYNEIFSVPMNIFGTNWEWRGNDTIATVKDPDRIYPFGVDPSWKGNLNTIAFYNSLKMKMSVLFGVTHMVVGIFISLLNALHFKKKLNIIGEFIPQMIFMLSLFGYLSFLIVYKWANSWKDKTPPFLLNVMINMFLSPYKLSEEDKLFEGQFQIQIILLLLALISVPWMLLVKPLTLRHLHKKKLAAQPLSLVEEEHEPEPVSHGDHGGGHGDHGEDGEFEFGEIFIKQIIHTIEFVLGAISNTASYLRLWALSLAHAELSEVFWDRVFIQSVESAVGMGAGGFIMVFLGFGAWAGATLGVLMGMETLSAFLHALRLHWVEFQNKFYLGDGKAFIPYSYERLLRQTED